MNFPAHAPTQYVTTGLTEVMTGFGNSGVTAAEAADAGPLPALLVAYTVKVYGSPLVNPVTMIGLEVPVAVIAPGFEVTV
jgi:energy-converting hydrogenase Eha subunit A